MPDTPWYHAGLHFECTGCGSCCGGAPGYVWVNKAEIAGLAARLGLDVVVFEKRYVRNVGVRKSLLELANGDCVFLDADKRVCSVYEARPRQCRTWPFWTSNLRTPADWEQLCRVCPGGGRGAVVPLEVIQAQASVMPL